MAKGGARRSNKVRQTALSEETDPYGLNEVDDFAAKNERILLEQSSLNRINNADDEDNLDDEEEEVMADEDSDSNSEEEQEEEEEEDEEEEELDGEKAYREVFGRKLDLGEPVEETQGAMLDEENAWGSTKNEYYGADDLDDDETAKEIEKEALRQQKKHLEELNMDDYMDDDVEEEWVKDAKAFDIAEFKASTKQGTSKVSSKDLLSMDSEARQDYLKSMVPEFGPLCKELSNLSPVLEDLKKMEATQFTNIKIMALSTYLGTISSYLGILLHELNNNDEFVSMKDHAVMEAILTSKEVWRQANDLPMSGNTEQIEDDEQESEAEVDDEIAELDENMLQDLSDGSGEETESGKGNDIDSNENESTDDSDADLDDFAEYVTESRVSKVPNKNTKSKTADDFIESEMADVDAQDKKARRRTLRFYTSKIDQQEQKKTDKFTGDEDIPYKERFFERQQRLLEEARKRGLHDPNGADLDGKDFASDDEAASKNVNDKSTNDYYEQISKQRIQRKESRKEAHNTAVIANREGKLAEMAEIVGTDGKRAINYQILKNKGLTPKRNKDNRNSRVKKRKKYEKAQKKLKSVRAVYSGGQSGAYEGEKTGIKKNLSRSVRFKN